jgi:hypothetical protein
MEELAMKPGGSSALVPDSLSGWENLSEQERRQFADVVREWNEAGLALNRAQLENVISTPATRRRFIAVSEALDPDQLKGLGVLLNHGDHVSLLATLDRMETWQRRFVCSLAAELADTPIAVDRLTAALISDPLMRRHLLGIAQALSPADAGPVVGRFFQHPDSGLALESQARIPGLQWWSFWLSMARLRDTPAQVDRVVDLLAIDHPEANRLIAAGVNDSFQTLLATPNLEARVAEWRETAPAMRRRQTFQEAATYHQLQLEIDGLKRHLSQLRRTPPGESEPDRATRLQAANNTQEKISFWEAHLKFLEGSGIFEESFNDENQTIRDSRIIEPKIRFPETLTWDSDSYRRITAGGPGRNYTVVINWKTGQVFARGITPNMPPTGTSRGERGWYPGIPQEVGAIHKGQDVPARTLSIPGADRYDRKVHGLGRPTEYVTHLQLAEDICRRHNEEVQRSGKGEFISTRDFVGLNVRSGHGKDFGGPGPQQIGITGFRFRSRSTTGQVIFNDTPKTREDGRSTFTEGVLPASFAARVVDFFFTTVGKSQEREELDRMNSEGERLAQRLGTTPRANHIEDLSTEFKERMRQLDLKAAERQRENARSQTKKTASPFNSLFEVAEELTRRLDEIPASPGSSPWPPSVDVEQARREAATHQRANSLDRRRQQP